MAKKKKIKQIKKGVESGFFFKVVKGLRQRYVKVVLRSRGKRTVTKQYRWRGGKAELYIREARIPRGTRYLVNYRKNQIIKSPKFLEQLEKRVKTRKRRGKATQAVIKKKEIFKELRLVPKIVRHPPEPVEAKKVIELLDGKVYYEREHPMSDFASQSQENKFLLNILSKATKNKAYAKNLLQNFDKIKLKMSYIIEIHGIGKDGKEQVVGHFTAIGKRPREIVSDLKENGIEPNEQFEVDYGNTQAKLESRGYSSININTGNYKITNVNMMVKFYNNPQRTL